MTTPDARDAILFNPPRAQGDTPPMARCGAVSKPNFTNSVHLPVFQFSLWRVGKPCTQMCTPAMALESSTEIEGLLTRPNAPSAPTATHPGSNPRAQRHSEVVGCLYGRPRLRQSQGRGEERSRGWPHPRQRRGWHRPELSRRI